MSKKEQAKENDVQTYTSVELVAIQNNLDSIGALKPKNADAARFIYAVNKNLDKVSKIVKRIQKMLANNDPQFDKYQEERFKLAIACGAEEQTLPNGTRSASSIKDHEKYQAGLEKLNKEYKKAIESQEKINKANNDLLEAEVDEVIEWHCVSYAKIPGEVNARQRGKLMFMLDEPTDEDFDTMDFFEPKEQA